MSSKFRHYLISFIGIAAPWITFAQASISSICSESVKDCVIQLELISNAHGQLLIQLQQQLSDNQRDIDLLRGQIQESQYKLNQVIERQKQILSQVNSFNNTGSVSLQSEKNTKTPIITPTHSNDANASYNAAIALMQDRSRQDDAIVAFQNFVKEYPNSAYQPNAKYWLGQLNYNKGKKDNAAFYFASVVKYYPKSEKAPAAMFKVGLIMQDKGNTNKAKVIYQQVIEKYPSTDGAIQAQKRLRAMR